MPLPPEGIDEALLAKPATAGETPEIDVVALAKQLTTLAGSGTGTATAGVQQKLFWGALALMLSGGGSAAALNLLGDLIPPNAELVERVEELEEAQREHERSLQEIGNIAGKTFDIVEQAHPPRGRVGVPQPGED